MRNLTGLSAIAAIAGLAAAVPASALALAQGQDTTKPASPFKPYESVIKNAKTRSGLFLTHQIGDKLYFEIPTQHLGKEFLLLSRSVESGQGFSGGGAELILKWERAGNKIVIREKRYDVVADSSSAIWRRVGEMQRGPILAAFDIQTFGADSAPVIEVTSLFVKAMPRFGSLDGLQADRSWIDHVAPLEKSVEVEATQTGEARGGGPGAGSQGVTARIHWSFYRLPDQPMMARYADERVGYRQRSYVDYGSAKHGAHTRAIVMRFRVEKKDPNAEVSDPVEPIVYWIDPATPDWLKPWVKKGVDAWQPAFQKIGFSNAIVGKVAPTREEDPDFSLHQVNRSVILWRPSTVANASGGRVIDPRSGEILKGEVNMYHNVMDLLQNWYFIQVAPLDPRAKVLPLPDSLMGRLVEYVVSHEVGHSMGFPHNMKASAMYPADSVRSVSFLRRMRGHVATLMDYSRFNYVAQPEDNIPVELLIPQIGPYDEYALMWGYKPIPGARTPEDELPTLDQWARMQDTIPWFRFVEGARNDPAALTEAVGDADAVKSSTLGMKNLERVMAMMIPAAEKPGQDYSLLETLYGEAVGQWGRYLGHVVAIVGGAQAQEKYGTGVRYTPESRARQQGAVAFLNQNAFRTPKMFMDPVILRRIETEGALNRIRDVQKGVLSRLLNPGLLDRLSEYEALAPAGTQVYTIANLLDDLNGGIFSELKAPQVKVDVYRRNLQRSYLEVVAGILKPPAPAPGAGGFGGGGGGTSDAKPALQNQLRELDAQLARAVNRAGDGMTRMHLRYLRSEIARVLKPE